MATFNGERYIRAQLTSILAGTVVPEQVVVADDGSTDGTVALVREVFSEHTGRHTELVILENGRHLGVTANFERAIASCDGDLIVLCDQDDLWHPDRLAAALPAFDDPAVGLEHADARLVDAEGRVIAPSLLKSLTIRPWERRSIASGRAFDAYIRRNLATGATVVVRGEVASLARPFPPEWVHDEWLAIIAAATTRAVLLDRPVIDYRQHGGNQIGAVAPTLAYRLSRFFQPRGDRFELLSRRASILAERLDQLGAPEDMRRLAREKERFERVRSSLPRTRVLRVPTVVVEGLRGSYRRLSSQGSVDILRDLLQPA